MSFWLSRSLLHIRLPQRRGLTCLKMEPSQRFQFYNSWSCRPRRLKLKWLVLQFEFSVRLLNSWTPPCSWCFWRLPCLRYRRRFRSWQCRDISRLWWCLCLWRIWRLWTLIRRCSRDSCNTKSSRWLATHWRSGFFRSSWSTKTRGQRPQRKNSMNHTVPDF